MKTAKEYWKDSFGRYPQVDAEKLAVAMMQDYAHDVVEPEVWNEAIDACVGAIVRNSNFTTSSDSDPVNIILKLKK